MVAACSAAVAPDRTHAVLQAPGRFLDWPLPWQSGWRGHIISRSIPRPPGLASPPLSRLPRTLLTKTLGPAPDLHARPVGSPLEEHDAMLTSCFPFIYFSCFRKILKRKWSLFVAPCHLGDFLIPSLLRSAVINAHDRPLLRLPVLPSSPSAKARSLSLSLPPTSAHM